MQVLGLEFHVQVSRQKDRQVHEMEKKADICGAELINKYVQRCAQVGAKVAPATAHWPICLSCPSEGKNKF